MSHILTMKTEFTNVSALEQAAQQCGARVDLTIKKHVVYGQTYEGRSVHLAGWLYPCVISPDGKTMHYDNYGGSWGDIKKFDQFKQAYEFNVSMATLGLDNMVLTHRTLPDGTIEITAEDQAADGFTPTMQTEWA